MISQISVRNYILFEKADVDLTTGMSVITGETGAGKSLLIDAIGYLCGARISGDIVRKPADKAILEMVVTSTPQASAFLEENGYDPEDELIITRTVTSQGKSQVRLNGRVTTLSLIRKLTSMLIDIHSQMDTIQLLDPAVQLDLLDQYAGAMEDRARTASLYSQVVQASSVIQKAKNESLSDDELEFVTARLNEIDGLQAREGELEELEKKIARAERSSKTEEQLQSLKYLLGKDKGLLESVYELSRLLKHDPDFAAQSAEVSDIYYQLEALKDEADSRLESLRDEAAGLDEMQGREYTLKRMYRKYGGSYASMMEKRAQFEQRVDMILHREELLSKLEARQKEAMAAYKKAADALHARRMSVIEELETAIVSHARDLMLEKAHFEIKCEPKTPDRTGMDQITFVASMNPGQPLTPIKDSASGGELSRLMLALKTVFQTRDGIDTIIFDEIDTGVSGKVALAMGSKMHALSETRQVLCITHLASVAVWADHHFRVAKDTDGQTTHTAIALLDEKESLDELAVMAHGQVSDAGVQGMRDLRQEIRHG